MSAKNVMVRYTVICAAILICLIFFQNPAYAGWARREVSKGNSLYSKEKYKDALREYEKALTRLPDSSIAAFNTGSAHYKLGDYKRAEEIFLKSLSTEDKELEAKASYNIGNSKYRQGEPVEKAETEKAIKFYKEALEYYKRAIELDETDEDAKFNYDFVKKKLEKLLKKEKQERQKQEKEEKKEKEDKKKPKEKEKQEEKEQKEKEKQQQDRQQEQKEQEKKKQEEKKEQKKKDKKKEQEKQDEERKRREEEKTQKEKEKQEREESRQQKQKEEEQKKEEQKEREKGEQPRPHPDELSEEEAKMLLEGFRQEEESKGKPVKARVGQYQEAVKDW